MSVYEGVRTSEVKGKEGKVFPFQYSSDKKD
jgi:hypothetical protein